MSLSHEDLLDTAGVLIRSSNNLSPTVTSLRRAQSTIYYAYFHSLAKCCADMLIGTYGDAETSNPAWQQTYRALEHLTTSKRCRNNEILQKFPDKISSFATAFASLQIKRHTSDYNPYPDPQISFTDVSVDLFYARINIQGFLNSSKKDKTAFCAYVLINFRKEERL